MAFIRTRHTKRFLTQKCHLQAFKLFDCDGDGNITASELKTLIEKVRTFSHFNTWKEVIFVVDIHLSRLGEISLMVRQRL